MASLSLQSSGCQEGEGVNYLFWCFRVACPTCIALTCINTSSVIYKIIHSIIFETTPIPMFSVNTWLASITTMNMLKSKPISIQTVLSAYKQLLRTVQCAVSWSASASLTHVQKCNSKIGHISLSLRRPSGIESSSSKMAGKLTICRRALLPPKKLG